MTHRQEALHFSENLLSATHAYTALSNPESDFWATKCSGNGHRPALDTLAMFDLVPNKILLLAAVDHFHSHELEKLLRAMVNWSVRGMIMSMMNRGRFEDQYSQIAVAIRKGEVTTTAQVRLRVEDLIPSDTDFREQFALATIGRSDSKLARYYLSALETTRRKESQPEFVPNSNPSQVNLEHVFPQNAKEADWEDFIKKSGDKQDAASWVYRIGNMVLLQAGVNSKIGNKSFAEKVEVFKASGFELTRKISEKSEWTPDSIRLRQTVLAGLAVKTWPR
ncbi:HNH endonuclease family protein [Streptomyces sp. NPDC051018]|uniref:HNH endonuclease family protein n=1 Tax=Streptomyces sp. NPDC051018 TaxID=3365639 RepID=UPI0037B476DF